MKLVQPLESSCKHYNYEIHTIFSIQLSKSVTYFSLLRQVMLVLGLLTLSLQS